MINETDQNFIQNTIALAGRGIGHVAPNPSVGCLIVSFADDPEGEIVGRGRTQKGGRPHAERMALDLAGVRAEGATVYVSLEPCAHTGQTAPCAQALIDAKVARVVCATGDPDPRVNGNGLKMLRAAGIDACSGVCEDEARWVNRGFFSRVERGRPYVGVKIASTLDGKIATHNGDSQWITDEPARARGHLLRAQYDAIMVGSATAIVDDPSLTCRLPGLEDRTPVRIVCDGRLRLPLTSKLVQTAADQTTFLATLEGADQVRLDAYKECGVHVIEVPPGNDGRIDMPEVLTILGVEGVNSVLIEGGGELIGSIMLAGLADCLHWFRSGAVLGGDGKPAVAGLGIDKLADAPRYKRLAFEQVGEDLLETWVSEA